ncbi:MAG: DnaD domain protein [Clostridia bacterium]|nr:DnaD domain protein [Clostridia bacterium]
MTYRFGKSYPDSFLTLPESVLDHVDKAGEGEVKLLLHLAGLLRFGPMEEEELLIALGEAFEQEEIRLALAFWRGCGVISTTQKKPARQKLLPKAPAEPEEPAAPVAEEPAVKPRVDADEAPFYSAKDLADAAEAVPDFKNLVAFAEGRLEKVMNTSELARLYSFLDYLKMPLDVVMLVIEDCVSRDKKSLRYITKMLTTFQDEGIDTYQKAEAWVSARQDQNVYERIVRRLFGLGERKLTAAEDRILRSWRLNFGYGEEILNAAYEKTVASAKNPSIKYMDKILEGWHRDGVKTPDDIGKKVPGGKAEKSYDADDFFEQAVSVGRKDLS